MIRMPFLSLSQDEFVKNWLDEFVKLSKTHMHPQLIIFQVLTQKAINDYSDFAVVFRINGTMRAH